MRSGYPSRDPHPSKTFHHRISSRATLRVRRPPGPAVAPWQASATVRIAESSADTVPDVDALQPATASTCRASFPGACLSVEPDGAPFVSRTGTLRRGCLPRKNADVHPAALPSLRHSRRPTPARASSTSLSIRRLPHRITLMPANRCHSEKGAARSSPLAPPPPWRRPKNRVRQRCRPLSAGPRSILPLRRGGRPDEILRSCRSRF
jgi:hypothetical protein